MHNTVLLFEIKGENELNNEPEQFATVGAEADVDLKVLALHLGSAWAYGSIEQDRVQGYSSVFDSVKLQQKESQFFIHSTDFCLSICKHL